MTTSRSTSTSMPTSTNPDREGAERAASGAPPRPPGPAPSRPYPTGPGSGSGSGPGRGSGSHSGSGPYGRAGRGPGRDGGAGRGPGRDGATRPPGRRDSRRPAESALRAAAHRERESQPPFWFARRLLLVLSGQCPVHTLLAHTRGAAYDRLSALAPLSPLRPRGEDRTTPAVLEARGSQPRQGVIEAFARVVTGSHQRAMAFRLELGSDRRWRCTAVEIDTAH